MSVSSGNFGSVLKNVQKQEIEMILDRRDKIIKVAENVIRNAEQEFKTATPKDTGTLAYSSFISKSGRNIVKLVIPKGRGERGNLVNILNNSKTRQRRSAGFWDNITLHAESSFSTKAKNVR